MLSRVLRGHVDWLVLLKLLLLLLLVNVAQADEHSHRYYPREDVIIWVNTVGPYSNRQETYPYYNLPFCRGNELVEHHHETLGEVLQGLELINAGIGTKFRSNAQNITLCVTTLNRKQVETFQYAVLHSYWYQMFVDDLPIWGFIGFNGEGTNAEQIPYLYTHKEFSFGYNDDQIIEVNLTSGSPIRLDTSKDMHVRFSYSIVWHPTATKYEHRFEKYLDQDFFEHKIHWFSIFNSFMMVIFLVGLVSIILLRTLRKDFARYDKKEKMSELERDLGDEYGWKLVHRDVFRRPENLVSLSAFLGTGFQLTLLCLTLLGYTIIGDLYTERATILTAAIFIYAVTAIVSGFFSGSYYSKYGGKQWIRTMFLTALLWPGVASVATILNNFVAIYYSSSRAIHFGTLVAIISIWFFLVFPLTLLGTVIGRHWKGTSNFPCQVNTIPRHIPPKKWYMETIVVILLGGLLPFGSIFIEMYFVFTSFWAYKIYYVYGFMLLVFLILLIVTACVAIVTTYFLLNSEDHRWPWTSFFTSGSASIYVYIYAIYYFFARTKMTGFFQIFFYFSYTAVVCFGLFIILGTVGFVAAEIFIYKIYSNLKVD